MACLLAESPSDPFHRELRQLRCLHYRLDCYRVERTSSRAGVVPAEVQRLSRRTSSPTGVFEIVGAKPCYNRPSQGESVSNRFAKLVLCLCAFTVSALAQQSHWATTDDPTAKHIIDSER